MGWDERQGRVSQAFSDWHMIDRDQRAFLAFGLRIAQETYDRLWDEAGREPGDPDGPELVDVFDDRVDGLWPHDYEWMYLAAVVRDAVTNFEVYLEKASEEVLAAHGAALESAPRWHELKDLFALLDVRVESGAVRRVRELRHFLTHQRGELRTEAQRDKFAANHHGLPPIVVELTEASVVEVLDQLGEAVRSIDPAVWDHTFGCKRIPELQIADPSSCRLAGACLACRRLLGVLAADKPASVWVARQHPVLEEVVAHAPLLLHAQPASRQACEELVTGQNTVEVAQPPHQLRRDVGRGRLSQGRLEDLADQSLQRVIGQRVHRPCRCCTLCGEAGRVQPLAAGRVQLATGGAQPLGQIVQRRRSALQAHGVAAREVAQASQVAPLDEDRAIGVAAERQARFVEHVRAGLAPNRSALRAWSSSTARAHRCRQTGPWGGSVQD